MARPPALPRLRRQPSWRRAGPLVWAMGLLVATLLGCARGGAAPGTLAYQGPQAYTLKPGAWLPGTDIRYVGQAAGGAEFAIGGQRAVKQKADSLNWTGSPAAGVDLALRLRIVWYTDEALYAAGTAQVRLSDIEPQAGEVPANAPLAYQMPVTYRVSVGESVPGSLLRYEGVTADGAKFGGIDGFAYRQAGDSVRWEGRVRPNAWLRLDLRLLQAGEQSATLGGLVHVWATP